MRSESFFCDFAHNVNILNSAPVICSKERPNKTDVWLIGKELPVEEKEENWISVSRLQAFQGSNAAELNTSCSRLKASRV